jgi:hypothetical protein
MPHTHYYPAHPGSHVVSQKQRQLVYQQCRQSVALAAGLEAMAVRAIEIGEATADQVEHMAQLSSLLTEQLEQLSAAFVELGASR